MKRDEALALFEAKCAMDCSPGASRSEFYFSLFLSGIAAGKRDDVEIVEKAAYTVIGGQAVVDAVRASLAELETK